MSNRKYSQLNYGGIETLLPWLLGNNQTDSQLNYGGIETKTILAVDKKPKVLAIELWWD